MQVTDVVRFSDDLSRRVAEVEPRWTQTEPPSGPNPFWSHWESNGRKVDIYVEIEESPAAAEAHVRHTESATMLEPDAREELGDEGLRWQPTPESPIMVVFRRDNVYAHIMGDAGTPVRRVARVIDELLSAYPRDAASVWG